MKIEEATSSGASSAATDEMLEGEHDSVGDRLSLLERKVHEQNDEILCLRATLADVLRRVNGLETVKPAAVLVKENIPVRYRNQDGLQGRQRRPHSSYIPNNHRNNHHYMSSGSLYSEDPSSGSASPTPVSPTARSGPLSPEAAPSPRRPNFSVKWGSGLNTPKKLSSSTSNLNRPLTATRTPKDFRGSTSSLNRASGSQSGSLNAINNISSSRRLGVRDLSYNAEDGSIKVYLRGRPLTFYIPSNTPYSQHKMSPLPTARLKLEWVYGYRGRDGRNNLYLLPTGEIVYFIAAVAVLYNIEEQTQRHYIEHTDDIKCMALHPNKLTIATGQVAGHKREGKPHVRIWDSVSLNTTHVIGLGEFERGIACLGFSRLDGGALLVVIDEAHDHNISIWDWHKKDQGHRITETKCSTDTVLCVEFHPFERGHLVTCGKGHLSFWSLDGGLLSKRNALLENRDRPKYFTCIAFSEIGDILTGDSNGSIIVWGRGDILATRVIKHAHDGSIFDLTLLKDGILLSGGKDGNIIAWDSFFKKTGQRLKLPDSLGTVRTISQGRGKQILVGTTRNWILNGSLDLGLLPVMAGHTEELCALAPHPTQAQFLTGGYDKIIRMWDSMSHQKVWSKELTESVRCACFSPDGSLLVVGGNNGQWVLLNAETREVISFFTDGQETIQAVTFSPDNKYLSIGSRDNNIYIYQVIPNNKLNRLGRCMGHSSFVLHLDWSTDSKYLRSTSGDHEILYWNAGICRQITSPSQLRDVDWYSQRTTLGYSVIGIWPEGADGTDVNCVSRSHSRKYLVTGDDFGKVKLFSHPANQIKSLSHSYSGHSSHVTGVDFLIEDSRVISIGGKDSSVMQWQLS